MISTTDFCFFIARIKEFAKDQLTRDRLFKISAGYIIDRVLSMYPYLILIQRLLKVAVYKTTKQKALRS